MLWEQDATLGFLKRVCEGGMGEREDGMRVGLAGEEGEIKKHRDTQRHRHRDIHTQRHTHSDTQTHTHAQTHTQTHTTRTQGRTASGTTRRMRTRSKRGIRRRALCVTKQVGSNDMLVRHVPSPLPTHSTAVGGATTKSKRTVNWAYTPWWTGFQQKESEKRTRLLPKTKSGKQVAGKLQAKWMRWSWRGN